MSKIINAINNELELLEAELNKAEPNDIRLEWHYRKIMHLNSLI